eukprot:SAG11_NODE_1874_length_4143_cov_10.521761_1_plen_267_part_00
MRTTEEEYQDLRENADEDEISRRIKEITRKNVPKSLQWPKVDFKFSGKPGTPSHDEHIRSYEAASQWVDDEFRTQHYFTTLDASVQKALLVNFESDKYNNRLGYQGIKDIGYAEAIAWVRETYQPEDILYKLINKHQGIQQKEGEIVQDYIRRRHQSRTILQGHGLLKGEADDWMGKSAFIKGLREKFNLQREIRREPGWFSLSLADTETLVTSYERAAQSLRSDRQPRRGNYAMGTPKFRETLNYANGQRRGFRQGSDMYSVNTI